MSPQIDDMDHGIDIRKCFIARALPLHVSNEQKGSETDKKDNLLFRSLFNVT